MSKYAPGSYWYYAPNKVAPIIFCVLFSISVVIHIYQNNKYHYWKPLFFLPWAGILFIAGTAVREAGAFDYDNLKLYIASSAMHLSVPPVFSAANYTILGRLLFYLPYLSPLHPGRVLSTFLGLDAIIEAITINGVARLANSDLPPSHQSVGGALVKAGLISQVVISLLFMVTVGVFHWNCHFHFQRRRPSTTTTTTSSPSLGSASASASASEEGSGKYHLQRPVPPSRKLKRIIKTLYISTILIIIRSIYGIVTAWDGLRARQQRTIPGVINRQEWFFWTWDGIAMLMNIYLWNLYYPGRYLPSDCKVYLSPNGDGVTETMGPGWKDERKWWVTVLDPFDFVGIVMGRDKKLGKFWEEEQEREREAEERRKRDLEMGSEGGEEGGKDGNGKGGKSKGEKDQKSWLGRIVQAISEHNLVAGG